MNWISEDHLSAQWLNWMRQIVDTSGEARLDLPHLITGMDRWDEAIATSPRAVGDDNRIGKNEGFAYAAAMLSRAAKQAIGEALTAAEEWHVNNAMVWQDLDIDEAKRHWENAYVVVTNVLAAWVQLRDDLAAYQHTMSAPSQEQLLAQWQDLGVQAGDVVTGTANAYWAQAR